MNLIPLYLRADDESAMIAELPSYMRGIDEQGNPIWAVAGLTTSDLIALLPFPGA